MAKSCPKCSRAMEQGFVVDQGDYGSRTASKWHGGEPNQRWWGLKTDKGSMREVRTWRCTSCGYLESYAL